LVFLLVMTGSPRSQVSPLRVGWSGASVSSGTAAVSSAPLLQPRHWSRCRCRQVIAAPVGSVVGPSVSVPPYRAGRMDGYRLSLSVPFRGRIVVAGQGAFRRQSSGYLSLSVPSEGQMHLSLLRDG